VFWPLALAGEWKGGFGQVEGEKISYTLRGWFLALESIDFANWVVLATWTQHSRNEKRI
jgi:hypothetical protein